ncbi:MAG: translesion DNA synthesis-associated protein ImuA [Rhodoferax sp.]|uniref:translesion DNA synthesis-associated protein ImuA n=1 Tax=Rhodoferax sp. TaxID=50421 RepID=UPI0013FE7481|nr:translesion DNA synthesis-associated protein ImuA [Rhodoferax sp.]NDP39003.1 translesion DNA synthesis-associated protein ImuA [Rhodoferax sp.]
MSPRSLSVASLDFGAAVWRADALAGACGATLASGHGALDSELPGGGWPVGALCEILQPPGVCQEWRLLLPALAHRPGPLVLVGPPHVPFGPGLAAQGLDARRLLWVGAAMPAQRLWAAEQALRCGEVGAVLAWLPQVRAEQLRRLQLAAQTHSKLLFVLRPSGAQSESSPAVLRLLLGGAPTIAAAVDASSADLMTAFAGGDVTNDALQVQILKRRGAPLARTLVLPARPASLAVLLALRAERPQAGPAAVDGQPTLAKPAQTLGARKESAHALDCLATEA